MTRGSNDSCGYRANRNVTGLRTGLPAWTGVGKPEPRFRDEKRVLAEGMNISDAEKRTCCTKHLIDT